MTTPKIRSISVSPNFLDELELILKDQGPDSQQREKIMERVREVITIQYESNDSSQKVE